jgi:3',5'-cyclic AMP phosphodiesterase CpdA
MLRLIHLSDIHITAPKLDWGWRDWFNKRLTSWFNLRWLGRGRQFDQADAVMAGLARELDERPPDHIIFSGDATALGFESELRRAAELLGVGKRSGLAVPGNHDYCTRPAACSGLFERIFAPWQTGRRVDDATYPFAQRVADLWLVAVNSCTGNRWAWDASGRVGADQLARLRRLLADLGPGRRILVTHYPVALAGGQREQRFHGLRDLDDLISVASEGGVCLWLHGHRHGFYHHAAGILAPFPVICSGSATQMGTLAFGEYILHDAALEVHQRVFDPQAGAFRQMDAFDLALSG